MSLSRSISSTRSVSRSSSEASSETRPWLLKSRRSPSINDNRVNLSLRTFIYTLRKQVPTVEGLKGLQAQLDQLLNSGDDLGANKMLVSELECLIRIHKRRSGLPSSRRSPYDFKRPAQYSKRLPSRKYHGTLEAELDFRGDDQPPFNIPSHADQGAFLRALRNPNHTEELQILEHQAYIATLCKPRIIKEESTVDTWRSQAADRGIRRAALQLALRTLARSSEQYYAGGEELRIPTLPAPKFISQKRIEIYQEMIFRSLQVADSPQPFRISQGVFRQQKEQQWTTDLMQSEGQADAVSKKICGVVVPVDPLLSHTTIFDAQLGKVQGQLFMIYNMLKYPLNNYEIQLYTSALTERCKREKNELEKALETRPLRRHTRVLYESFEAGWPSIKTGVTLYENQDKPISDKEKQLLLFIARSPENLSLDPVLTDNLKNLTFRAGRQYARIRNFRKHGIKGLEEDLRLHRATVQRAALETLDAIKILFPDFSKTHYLQANDIIHAADKAKFNFPPLLRGPNAHIKCVLIKENKDDLRDTGAVDKASFWSFVHNLAEINMEKLYFSSEKWPLKPTTPVKIYSQEDISAEWARRQDETHKRGWGYTNLTVASDQPTARELPEEVGLILGPNVEYGGGNAVASGGAVVEAIGDNEMLHDARSEQSVEHSKGEDDASTASRMPPTLSKGYSEAIPSFSPSPIQEKLAQQRYAQESSVELAVLPEGPKVKPYYLSSTIFPKSSTRPIRQHLDASSQKKAPSSPSADTFPAARKTRTESSQTSGLTPPPVNRHHAAIGSTSTSVFPPSFSAPVTEPHLPIPLTAMENAGNSPTQSSFIPPSLQFTELTASELRIHFTNPSAFTQHQDQETQSSSPTSQADTAAGTCTKSASDESGMDEEENELLRQVSRDNGDEQTTPSEVSTVFSKSEGEYPPLRPLHHTCMTDPNA